VGCPLSENYPEMVERGLLINNEYGVDAQHVFIDHDVNGPVYFLYYDATSPTPAASCRRRSSAIIWIKESSSFGWITTNNNRGCF
jgi:hypothetical protein